MPLLVNSLVEWTDPEGIPTVERILSIDNDGLMTHVIRIDKPDALPRPRNMPEIQSALADGRAKVLTVDPYAYLQQPEATIPENHRVELELPQDMPVGPAEVIVLAGAPQHAATPRPLGMDAGLITISEDFDAPLPAEIQRAFEGEP